MERMDKLFVDLCIGLDPLHEVDDSLNSDTREYRQDYWTEDISIKKNIVQERQLFPDMMLRFYLL